MIQLTRVECGVSFQGAQLLLVRLIKCVLDVFVADKRFNTPHTDATILLLGSRAKLYTYVQEVETIIACHPYDQGAMCTSTFVPVQELSLPYYSIQRRSRMIKRRTGTSSSRFVSSSGCMQVSIVQPSYGRKDCRNCHSSIGRRY